MDEIKALYRLNVKKPHLVTLMILSAFASMGAILMMPALPEIAAHFHIHTSTAQLTVTCFLL
jgi:predicted MFS family arabinose efflux permease